ncbi:hypothetical protein EMIT091MI3_30083 [Kosakonia quasisacchari]
MREFHGARLFPFRMHLIAALKSESTRLTGPLLCHGYDQNPDDCASATNFLLVSNSHHSLCATHKECLSRLTSNPLFY